MARHAAAAQRQRHARSQPAPKRPSPLRFEDRLGLLGAGVIGTLLRVGIADILPTGDDGLPWGTLIVNVAGCFVLAAMVTVWNRARLPSRAMRSLHIAVGTGLIGAFTTFSDYAVEVIELARDDLMLGSAYALGSLAAGVAAGMLGIQLGRVARRERVPA